MPEVAKLMLTCIQKQRDLIYRLVANLSGRCANGHDVQALQHIVSRRALLHLHLHARASSAQRGDRTQHMQMRCHTAKEGLATCGTQRAGETEGGSDDQPGWPDATVSP